MQTNVPYRSLNDPILATVRDTSSVDCTLVPGEAYRTLMYADATLVPQQAGYQSILGNASPPVSEPERYQIGDRIGDRYEVLAIHKGSMGIVYGTFDHKERLPRALKTLQRRFAGNMRMQNLFAEEAALWVRLEKHPFIVRAYLVQNFENQPYVITEYIRGRAEMGGDLCSWLGSPLLTLPVAIEMGLQIAQALQYATAKMPGFIHGDLKPANVLVDDRGRAMVTDFGLAVAAEAGAGTPAYMAPELWKRDPSAERSDMYAFGCILYEMLTGHRLFPAATMEAWRDCHLYDLPIPPRALNSDIPEELEKLVLSCLAKETAFRPSTWEEIVGQCALWFHRLTGQPAVLDFSAYKLTTEELLSASFSLEELQKWPEAIDLCNRILAIDPNHPMAWYNKGVALSELEREEDSLAAYERALSINPGYASAWNNKGAVLRSIGRTEEAIVAYEHALAIKPRDCNQWYNKGLSLCALGRNNEAVEAFDTALSINPSDIITWINKGSALLAIGKIEEAFEAANQAAKLIPDNARDLYSMGMALERHGLKMAALKAFERVLVLAPSDNLASFQRETIARAYARLNDADRSLDDDPDDSYAWQSKGHTLFWMHQYEGSLACSNKALEIDPDDFEAWEYKGRALSILGQNEEAIKAYDKSLEINPENDYAWLGKGFDLFSLGRNEESVEAYFGALESNPEDENVWFCESFTEDLLPRQDTARKANRIGFAEAWFQKGLALSEIGRFKEAVAVYNCALVFKSEDSRLWNYKGLALAAMGLDEEALTAYNQALVLNPENANALNNKNIVLSAIGRNEEAASSHDGGLAINLEYSMPPHMPDAPPRPPMHSNTDCSKWITNPALNILARIASIGAFLGISILILKSCRPEEPTSKVYLLRTDSNRNTLKINGTDVCDLESSYGYAEYYKVFGKRAYNTLEILKDGVVIRSDKMEPGSYLVNLSESHLASCEEIAYGRPVCGDPMVLKPSPMGIYFINRSPNAIIYDFSSDPPKKISGPPGFVNQRFFKFKEKKK